jgi:hypothetical protein
MSLKSFSHDLNIGDLINLFYQEYLALYGDEELASVATAATINDIIIERDSLSSITISADMDEAA